MRDRLLLMLIFFVPAACSFSPLWGQTKVIIGQIRDQHSAEPVPFASVQFKRSGIGKLADSAGTFILHFDRKTTDTLEITSVGYQDYQLFIDGNAMKSDTLKMVFQLVP